MVLRTQNNSPKRTNIKILRNIDLIYSLSSVTQRDAEFFEQPLTLSSFSEMLAVNFVIWVPGKARRKLFIYAFVSPAQ